MGWALHLFLASHNASGAHHWATAVVLLPGQECLWLRALIKWKVWTGLQEEDISELDGITI